jgi:hypothetical protein
LGAAYFLIKGIHHCMPSKNTLYFTSPDPSAFLNLNLMTEPMALMAGNSGVFRRKENKNGF